MYNKKGFGLLVFLLYLALFSMMTVLICHVSTSLIIPSLQSLRKCQEIINLHIATDLFVRDIRTMRTTQYEWKQTAAQELIWHQKDTDLGWCLHNGTIERKEGIYANGWKNTTTTIIAKGAAQASFDFHRKKERIQAIELTIIPRSSSKKPIMCYVSLLPGEKHEK